MHSHRVQRIIVWSALALLLVVAIGSLAIVLTMPVRPVSHDAPLSADRLGQPAAIRFLAPLPSTNARLAVSQADQRARGHEQPFAVTVTRRALKAAAELDSSCIYLPLRI